MPSAANNAESRVYDTFFTSTKVAYVGEPVDSVYKEPVSWKWVRGLSDAGSRLGERVEFGVMVGSFNGSTDLAFGSLDTVTPQDSEIAVPGWLNPFTKAMSVGISKQKLDANKGAMKYNYVKGQLDQAIRGQHAEFNTDIWASSQDALKILSIATAVSTTTSTGSVTNLSRATYSRWRQTYTNLAGDAFTVSGLNGARDTEHSIRRGPTTGGPDTIFWNDTVDALWQRLTDGKEWTEMATGGGKGKKPVISESSIFRGCEILPEPVDYPDSTSARFLDSTHWHFKPFQKDLPGDPKSPYNDGAGWYAYPVVQSGAFWCDSLRWGAAVMGNFLAS